MAIKFNLGNGTSAYVEDNAHMIDTQRGMVVADQIVQGDLICNVSGQPRNEVMSAPAVVI